MPKHEFMALIQYDLTAEQARALHEGPVGPPTFAEQGEQNPRVLADGRANLRIEDIRESPFAGCRVCELPYTPGMENTECPGQPNFYTPKGEPIWK